MAKLVANSSMSAKNCDEERRGSLVSGWTRRHRTLALVPGSTTVASATWTSHTPEVLSALSLMLFSSHTGRGGADGIPTVFQTGSNTILYSEMTFIPKIECAGALETTKSPWHSLPSNTNWISKTPCVDIAFPLASVILGATCTRRRTMLWR